MDVEKAKKAFAQGQDAAFREQVILWAMDESITNEEFSTLVCDLGFQQALSRTAFGAAIELDSRVDISQADDVR